FKLLKSRVDNYNPHWFALQARPDAHCAVLMGSHYRGLVLSDKQKLCVFLRKAFKCLINNQFVQTSSKTGLKGDQNSTGLTDADRISSL
ncbi:hypothetical protein, partial [Aeromonas tecta]|uniref:hypothetical protein n=1 Tax=Aeromonas tecta TaxID=324617 RepID=UPI001E5104BA